MMISSRSTIIITMNGCLQDQVFSSNRHWGLPLPPQQIQKLLSNDALTVHSWIVLQLTLFALFALLTLLTFFNIVESVDIIDNVDIFDIVDIEIVN